MRNRRVNVYKNTKLNQVVTDYRAGTPLKNVNTQEEYKSNISSSIPGGFPTGNVKVPLAGTRISRVRAAPIGGYRKTLATKADGSCCTENGLDGVNQNGFTQEIYKDTWTDCSGVCSGDKEGIVARPTRTKKPLIRSGMQYNSSVKEKKYAFSYSQYQKNLRCLSYERSQEKFPTTITATSTWTELGGPTPIVYKKSGCNGCCKCCVNVQAALIGVTTPAEAPILGDEVDSGGYSGTITDVFPLNNANFYITVKKNTTEPCDGIVSGATLNNSRGPYTYSVLGVIDLFYSGGSCTNARPNTTIYKPNNKKFKVQGAVSSGSRLERLKLDTIQGSRISTRHSNDSSCALPCNPSSKKFTLGYRSAKPRFVTNPNEGGAKTRGFVPTRWRQAYLAHGRSIGNIFQRTSSYNMSGKGAGALPYSIGSIKTGGCCHPPNAGTTN